MLTTDAINDFKDFIDNIIAYAKVTVNGVSLNSNIRCIEIYILKQTVEGVIG